MESNKIIRVDGKPHMEAQVHMLPTDKSEIYKEGDKLYFNPKTSHIPVNPEPQHLYITSDEEIKIGDWFITNYRTLDAIDVEKCLDKEHCEMINKRETTKKIIATTDPKLNSLKCDKVRMSSEIATCNIIPCCGEFMTAKQLPQPSQSFIEEYCKVGGIDEVLVEVECVGEKGLLIVDFSKDEPETVHRQEPECIGYTLKLNPDNTIIIHPVGEKVYSKEEVIKLMNKLYYDDLHLIGGKFDKWIEENL